MLVPVYDIVGCGPRRRFVANGALVHNSDKVNLQNLPRKSPLKKAIRAPEGYVFIDVDSSQIEARTLAWLAGQTDLVEAFERGEDVYKRMASAIYNKAEEDITPEERFVGKTTVLGSGYGTGWSKLQLALKGGTPSITVSEPEAKRIIDAYRRNNSAITAYWKECDAALDAMAKGERYDWGPLYVDGHNGLRLPNGLHLKYPNLRWETDEKFGRTGYHYDTRRGRSTLRKGTYGSALTENICQALARIIIGNQLLLVAKRYRVVLTVHDAIGCIAPEAKAAEAKAYVEQCMRVRPSWAPDLPLNCEGGYGSSYGECK